MEASSGVKQTKRLENHTSGSKSPQMTSSNLLCSPFLPPSLPAFLCPPIGHCRARLVSSTCSLQDFESLISRVETTSAQYTPGASAPSSPISREVVDSRGGDGWVINTTSTPEVRSARQRQFTPACALFPLKDHYVVFL